MKVYMKRTYSKRYNKFFKKEIKNSKNKQEKKRLKPKNIENVDFFGGGNIFGRRPKRSKNNPFGF